MQRNKFVAILIAVILPLGTYLVVSNLSENAVTMPRRYFYDSVGTTTIRGKTVPDTLWHKIRPFRLQNQLGDTVGGCKISWAIPWDWKNSPAGSSSWISSLHPAHPYVPRLRAI